MSSFNEFKQAIQTQFDKMSQHELFYVDVSKDILWETYLNSFPAGTNPMFRERTEHDCQCCKQFIRACGNVVAVVDGELQTIWDINVDSFYQAVADSLSETVKSRKIKNVFRYFQVNLGTDYNYDNKLTDPPHKWEHFHYKLPAKFVMKKDIDSFLGKTLTNKQVLERSLKELTIDSANIVLELIDQNSLYRGKEFRSIVSKFLDLKRKFDKLSSEKAQDFFLWEKSLGLSDASKIKNTVIGTLLSDLSLGTDLEQAVASFEAKVAPQNYKRPTALVTRSMIENAQKKVSELGIKESLQRRHATQDDLTINNVLFADRSVKESMNVFDELINEVPDKVPNLDKVEEIFVEKFLQDILPKARTIEVMLDNSHVNNMVSLIAPCNRAAPNILKWNNNFSWSYNGGVTDSIKERVKKAGGNVTGDLRVSLSWFNYDDLDLHAIEPNGNRICFNSKKSKGTGGFLDVDMNAGSGKSREAVENIVWKNKSKMLEGKYEILVHNFCLRERDDVGFDLELEFDGKTYQFHYDKTVKNKEYVTSIIFEYSHKNGVKIVESLPQLSSSKEIWNVSTNKWQKVNMVLKSPNHWDGQSVGNEHLFFILDNCLNPDDTRGLYNEFLQANLMEHRKVFEVLGNKLKAPYSEQQLSGVGFSSTQQNTLLCKVSGSFNRVIKVVF